jgi:peptide/nickel transport system substrate-binding protein
MLNRRSFLTTAALAGAGLVLPRINPDFVIGRAHAQLTRPLVFLSAENITGNWDPTAHTTLSQTNIEGFVMGYLTRAPMRPEAPDDVIYELATEITELSASRLQIKLRSGVTFHDGKPFTSEDVKATLVYGAQSDRPKQVFPGPTETFDVETPDDHTVIIDTSKGGYGASLFVFLASYLPVLSAADVAAGPKGPISQRLNGTGPFKFVEQRGNDTVMEAFPGYFKGAPTIPGVTFSFVGDATTRMLSLMNGQADVIERLEPEQVETLEGNTDIKLSRLVSVENKYLWFRCSKPPFNDPRLRKAVAHAIDRSLLMEVMGNAAEASSNFISPIKLSGV